MPFIKCGNYARINLSNSSRKLFIKTKSRSPNGSGMYEAHAITTTINLTMNKKEGNQPCKWNVLIVSSNINTRYDYRVWGNIIDFYCVYKTISYLQMLKLTYPIFSFPYFRGPRNSFTSNEKLQLVASNLNTSSYINKKRGRGESYGRERFVDIWSKSKSYRFL